MKVYPSQTVGFTATARWTPTYIKSDPAGVWCSPYWGYGCYVLSNAQYSNQFELSGGLTQRRRGRHPGPDARVVDRRYAASGPGDDGRGGEVSFIEKRGLEHETYRISPHD